VTQTFYPITPVEVTPGTASSWQDVDVSSYIPSGSTGVILRVCNTGISSYNFGVRKNGSTDSPRPYFEPLTHCWAAIGVDDNRIFEAYVGNTTDIDLYLVGYTTSGVTFRTNEWSPTFGSNETWVDLDCSSEVPSGAVGIIFHNYAPFSVLMSLGLRKNGSTDDRHSPIDYNSCFGAIVGCDSSRIVEGWREGISLVVAVVGYISDGATFNTNATEETVESEGAWHDLSPALPSGSVMGFIEVHLSVEASLGYGLRKNGSSENMVYYANFHPYGFVECDSNRIIEGLKSENPQTYIYFYLTGYALEELQIGARFINIGRFGVTMFRAGRQ